MSRAVTVCILLLALCPLPAQSGSASGSGDRFGGDGGIDFTLRFDDGRGAAPGSVEEAPQDAEPGPKEELRYLHEEGEPYRTPRAGEGFRTTVLGRQVTVEPRDRRSVSAWALGFAATIPGAEDNEVLPVGSLFFWRHPHDDFVFRGVVAGVFNDILAALSTPGTGHWDLVVTFENFTVPADRSEIVDGEAVEAEELNWGYIRPGIGVGYRFNTWPWNQDNMFFAGLTFEPGYYYFDEGSDAAAGFAAPQDTFELRARLQVRWDGLERNLLELPHTGFALGSDLFYGYRTNWEDWGIGLANGARNEKDFVTFSAYGIAATGVPFVSSERHRIITTVHGGVGSDLDRFSALRVGGGPQGEEFRALARPIIPGAAIEEFFSEHFVVGLFEYRWEAAFFTYLSARTSLSFLDRARQTASGITREDDLLFSIGGRITTGFIGDIRIQLDYNYNAGVIRGGDFGGHEVWAQVSREF